ncbi:hypothetical protein M5K25_013435 [Dendrobium thyrsiflorum]|uniref:Uncharacterized protein n=1 Tax=Dendrobium thyrsiflorum TaxID=117978 RepID=A0ABD0UT11_DENTH
MKALYERSKSAVTAQCPFLTGLRTQGCVRFPHAKLFPAKSLFGWRRSFAWEFAQTDDKHECWSTVFWLVVHGSMGDRTLGFSVQAKISYVNKKDQWIFIFIYEHKYFAKFSQLLPAIAFTFLYFHVNVIEQGSDIQPRKGPTSLVDSLDLFHTGGSNPHRLVSSRSLLKPYKDICTSSDFHQSPDFYQ